MFNICNDWQKNPTKNPRTGRKILKTGKVYKDLEKECGKDKSKDKSEEQDLCEKFMKNPNINPATGRTIQSGKAVYNKYMKMCKSYEQEDDCYEDEDPITMEKFNETSEPIIKLGKGKKKHCFLVTSIYKAIVAQQLDEITPVNPMTKEPISGAEISEIFKIRKEYVESTNFQPIQEKEKHKLVLTSTIKDLETNYDTYGIVEIKNLSPQEVISRYDNLLKKGRRSDALRLRIIWDFFNFSENKRFRPLRPVAYSIANHLFNTIRNQINNLSVPMQISIFNITKLTRKELKTRRSLLDKIDNIQSILAQLIWNEYSVNNN